MTIETVWMVLLILFLAGTLPTWSYSRSWGYGPMGVLSVLLIIFVVWAVVEQRPLFKRSGQSVSSTLQSAGEELKEAGRDMTESIRDTVQ